eukprot:PhF_6_TR7048/c1_g1_i3/m.10603
MSDTMSYIPFTTLVPLPPQQRIQPQKIAKQHNNKTVSLSVRLCCGEGHAYALDGIVEHVNVTSTSHLMSVLEYRLKNLHNITIVIGSLEYLAPRKNSWVRMTEDTNIEEDLAPSAVLRIHHTRRCVLIVHTRCVPVDERLPERLRAQAPPRRFVCSAWGVQDLREQLGKAYCEGGVTLPENVQIVYYSVANKRFVPLHVLGDLTGLDEIA